MNLKDPVHARKAVEKAVKCIDPKWVICKADKIQTPNIRKAEKHARNVAILAERKQPDIHKH